MKKVLLATAVLMALGSSSAMAVEGGRINFEGFVSVETCQKIVHSSVGDSDTDGTVTLETAHVGDITGEVQAATVGVNEEDFSIAINCKDAGNSPTTAHLSMSSTYGNTKGTLDNDETLSRNGVGAAKAVDIAIHRVDDTGTINQVKINDLSTTLDQAFVDKVATYNFKASYVKSSDANAEVTSGLVATNATYTFTYE